MSSLDGRMVAAVAHLAGFSGGDLVTAVAIAKAESGWDPNAEHKNSNGSTDYGLWQINSVNNPTDNEKYNPISNARKAHELYASRKFAPWVTYTNGTYRRYMSDASKAVDDLRQAGPDYERRVRDSIGPDKVPIPAGGGSTSWLESVGNAVSGATEAVSSNPLTMLTKIPALIGVYMGFILGTVCVVLGVLILARKPAMRTASKVKTVSKVIR